MGRTFKVWMLTATLVGINSISNAAPATFTATLSGAAENPPVVTAGNGSATVTLDTAAHTLVINVTFANLTGTSTMAHIHCCAAAPTNSGVASMLPAFTGFPLGVSSGTFLNTFNTLDTSSWNPVFITNNGGTPVGAEAALATALAAGQAYLNIHSSTNGAGEIRGFLAPPAVPIAQVPTLSVYAFGALALLLAAAGFFALRRRSA
ncbi:MAG: CHRD domain-containing protein [Acidobacteriota bacterium]